MTQVRNGWHSRSPLALEHHFVDVQNVSTGSLYHYRYPEDNVDIVVPERSLDIAMRPNATRAIVHGINVSLGYDFLREDVETFDTPHGRDEVERFNGFSLVKLADRALLEYSLLRAPDHHRKVAAIFGESAVMVCDLNENGHRQLTEDIRKVPHPDIHMLRAVSSRG